MGRIRLRQLEWITILAPVAFLLTVDYLRHFVFGAFLHSWAGFALIYATVLVGVTVFAQLVFCLFQGMQAKDAQQNRELLATSEIAESLSRSLNIDHILQGSLDRVMSLTEADAGVICLLDAEKKELFSTAHRGFSPAILERVRRQKLGEEPIGTQVVKTGLPVFIPNLQEYGDPRLAEMARQEGFLSSLSFPLASGGNVVGVLALASRRKGAFSESTLRLISGIANQVAMAAERASLFAQVSRRVQDMGALNELSMLLSSSLNLSEVIEVALDRVMTFLDMDAGEVWLWEESAQEMVLSIHSGAFPEAFREVTRFKRGEGFPGQVALTGEAVVCPDISQDGRFLRNAVRTAGIHFFACVPLKAKGKVVGALDIAAKGIHQLTPRELQLLTSIGNQIGVAVENARLHQRVQSLAVTEERGRIARETHDGVAQLLGYVTTKIIAVKTLLDTSQADLAREQLSQLETAAHEAYADVREVIVGLRTSLSRRQGFIPILEEYLENLQRMTEISIALSVTPKDAAFHLTPQMEIQLVRIIQEALSNVRKHSGASQAWVRVAVTNSEIRVVIGDNGRGFDPSWPSRGDWPRFGLQTMRERAETIEGRLEIKSRPGSGTEVRVSLPYSSDLEKTSAHIAR